MVAREEESEKSLSGGWRVESVMGPHSQYMRKMVRMLMALVVLRLSFVQVITV